MRDDERYGCRRVDTRARGSVRGPSAGMTSPRGKTQQEACSRLLVRERDPRVSKDVDGSVETARDRLANAMTCAAMKTNEILRPRDPEGRYFAVRF